MLAENVFLIKNSNKILEHSNLINDLVTKLLEEKIQDKKDIYIKMKTI